jgi:hypothetical protein
MYWGNVNQSTVQGINRANLDGSGAMTIVGAIPPWGVAVDPAIGKVFWVNVSVGNESIQGFSAYPPEKVYSRNQTARSG